MVDNLIISVKKYFIFLYKNYSNPCETRSTKLIIRNFIFNTQNATQCFHDNMPFHTRKTYKRLHLIRQHFLLSFTRISQYLATITPPPSTHQQKPHSPKPPTKNSPPETPDHNTTRSSSASSSPTIDTRYARAPRRLGSGVTRTKLGYCPEATAPGSRAAAYSANRPRSPWLWPRAGVESDCLGELWTRVLRRTRSGNRSRKWCDFRRGDPGFGAGIRCGRMDRVGGKFAGF